MQKQALYNWRRRSKVFIKSCRPLAFTLAKETVMPTAAPLRIVQITDLHLKSTPGSRLASMLIASLSTVLARIQAHHPQPDFLLVTGDLVGDEPKPMAGCVSFSNRWAFRFTACPAITIFQPEWRRPCATVWCAGNAA